jgi:hypothetical protein
MYVSTFAVSWDRSGGWCHLKAQGWLCLWAPRIVVMNTLNGGLVLLVCSARQVEWFFLSFVMVVVCVF